MKPSNELFVLIKSLTKSEKRFFKLSSAIQTGEKNYLKIFDFIEKSSEYDESELKDHFKNERFIKHLPSEKNHLYKLILKSLRSFYSEQSISSILKEELKNIEILFNKALYKECRKFLKRAKRIASESEKFYYLIELIAWEKKLIEEFYESGDFNVNLEEIIKEEEEVIAKLRNLAEYHVLYSKINAIFRSGGFAKNAEERKTVDEIADYHLIKGKNTAISTRAASICYYIKGLCAATQRNYKDSYTFFNKTKSILDDHPKLKQDLAQRYLSTLFHLHRSYVDSAEYEKAQEMLNEIKALDGKKGFKSTDISLKIRSISFNEQLIINNHQGVFKASVEQIEQEESSSQSWRKQISKERNMQLLYNSAYTYFGYGDYKKALHYVNLILNDNEQNLRQDIYNFTKILNLIIHLELQNYEYLDYVVKSTSRYIKKTERDYSVEHILIKYIRKLIKLSDPEASKDTFKEMYEEFSELLINHDERVILEYMDIKSWIYSKYSECSMKEAIASVWQLA